MAFIYSLRTHSTFDILAIGICFGCR